MLFCEGIILWELQCSDEKDEEDEEYEEDVVDHEIYMDGFLQNFRKIYRTDDLEEPF